MTGNSLLVKDNTLSHAGKQPGVVRNLWSRAVGGAKDLFKTTQTTKKVVTDEHGNFIDDVLPIFYVGLPQDEKALENIDNDFDFKGFIDLVVKTPDGKYHILDLKTCSWGWKPKRKSDAMTTYQLTFYKNYFAQKHNIDPKNIETYFALLKRTAKKDNVEIFRVTSGPKKTKNALNLLQKALHNIKKDFHPKNRSACQTPFGMCEFYNTEHCA